MYTLVNREVPFEEAFTLSRGDDSQLTLWHKHFRHLYADAVLKMSSKHLVSGMPILQSANGHHRCQSCLEGKMTRLPFLAAMQQTTAPLQLIHSDLCGPMNQKSLGRSLYFMLLIDDYTKFTAVYFLKKKSEAAECFKNCKAHVEKVHSQKGNQYVIKAVRTDGGGEFTGGVFLRELEKYGIEAHTTVPYTPQEDGISENGNRVLVGHANTLLKQAGASNSYWAEAIQTCVYLKNISLTKGKHEKEATPFKLWFGKKPSVEHLRVWGCSAYAYVHTANRADKKWCARAEKLMFVGYTMTTRQYRLYNPKTRAFIKS